VLERWTRAVLRFRVVVLVCWLAVLGVGIFASVQLPGLLSNSFAVPGTDSARAQALLSRGFGERTDGTFTVVFPVAYPSDKALRARLERRLALAAHTVPTGRASRLQQGPGILYGDVTTRLDLQHAKRYTTAVRRALGAGALVTGQPAIQHDLDPILAADLRRGEAIALPFALVVLIALFGFSLAVAIPFLFAACTITATLAGVYAVAHLFPVVAYVTNLVELIGLGLAIDYSLLIVYRFREELDRGDSTNEAIVRTMDTAGRAVVFSGLAVAIGLAVLLFVPVPFIRSMGVGGVLVPLASIAAALTLQPALLSLFGDRVGGRRARAVDPEHGIWARLSRSIMRRPIVYLAVGTVVMLTLAAPALFLRLTPGSLSGIPSSPESMRGYALLRDRVGAGAVMPTEIAVDGARPARAAIARLAYELFRDPEVLIVASGTRPPFVDPGGRYARVVVAGRHEYGARQTQSLVRRIRSTLIPAARFPAGARVYAGGAPSQGVDFLERTYRALPWLVLAVLVLTYLVLLRAFRSVVLPLKAVVLNLLSVAAACGMLVLVFQWGRGLGQIEGWVPIVLFATLFGISMDYEVFMVTRMRESWDHVPDNARAVAHGLQRTGRIVTAAALIMVAAFSGFVAGRVQGLQELGLGLALAVLFDATIIRAVLVPSLMAVLGRWNWWLPAQKQ
jgi:uncharacterized membrane protein YdfJ with MMPL/SSD domain